MKKFAALLTKEKRLRMRENNDSDYLQALYSVYKKLGQFFSHTCLNKDTSVILKVIYIWLR